MASNNHDDEELLKQIWLFKPMDIFKNISMKEKISFAKLYDIWFL